MPKLTEDFLKFVGQTSPAPLKLELKKAKGVYFYTNNNEKYIDFTSGVAVSNLGHNHPKIVKAIQKQAEEHLHSMVYGEFVESPQVEYAKLLTEQLPAQLNCLYYCTSGSEAVEASLKLAKRKTGRSEIVYFEGSYHGSTHGALSVMGSEQYKTAYRPLLPMTKMLRYNHLEDLHHISEKSAAVIVEVVQAASGVTVANKKWLEALRNRCNEVGAVLIFDEVQTGFGRTGKLFAFEHFQVFPDILLIAKAMGGGIPIGGLVANIEDLQLFTKNPALGHINTFGGNSIACASAIATLQILVQEKKIIDNVERKAKSIVSELAGHRNIEKITYKGLLMAIHFKEKEFTYQFIEKALVHNVVLIGFLLNEKAVRLAPPLTITEKEMEEALLKIVSALDEINN